MTSLSEISPSSPSMIENEEPVEKKDWVKITGIVIAIIAGVIGAFAFFCARGTFPVELLGGRVGLAYTFVGAVCLLSVGGGIFFFRWLRSKEEKAESDLYP